MLETKYLILSMENQCIYTMTRDPVLANSLASSNINTLVRPITRHNFKNFNEITNRDYFKDKIYKAEPRDDFLAEVNSANVSQGWKDERLAMYYRQDALVILEVQYLTSIAPIETYYSPIFSNELWQELLLCDPVNNVYTRYIEEYARIFDKPVDQIYKELKLKIEGEKFIQFRINALVERWKIKINQIKNLEDFQKARTDMVNEFWVKSRI